MAHLAAARNSRAAVARKRRAAVLPAVARKRRAAAVDSPEAADNSRGSASSAVHRGRDGSPEGRRKAARTKKARCRPKGARSRSRCG